MTYEKLQEILNNHKAWLDGEPDGSRANLSRADLRGANLSDADLRRADLSDADLSDADLSDANLRGADLRRADLSDADLSDADLSDANLSRAKNLLSSINYMDANFERTPDGYIVYKTFGAIYPAPKDWKIEPGSVIGEVVNPCRTNDCGCGINAAPIEWVRKNYKGAVWKCLIRWEWLIGVIVPYNTDGKIRCERIELVEDMTNTKTNHD